MKENLLRIRKENHVVIAEFALAVNDGNGMVNLAYDLMSLCRQINTDPDVKVVVMADIAMGAFDLGETVIEDTNMLDPAAGDQIPIAINSIANLDQPVIAAIHGNAVGFGLELAMACDLRIAADTSWFGLPHVKKGVIPWGGGSQRLPRIVGKGKALEMILTGTQIDAVEAMRIGLATRVTQAADLMPQALKMAKVLAGQGPLAMRFAKEAIGKGMDLSLGQGLRLEADLYYLLHTSSDRTEGIQAFQERRPPKFKGE